MGSDRVVPRTATRTLRALHHAIHGPRTRGLRINEPGACHQSAASLAATHASVPNPTNVTLLLEMPFLRSDIVSLAHAAIARARAALAACHSTHVAVHVAVLVPAPAELHFEAALSAPPLRPEPARTTTPRDFDGCT